MTETQKTAASYRAMAAKPNISAAAKAKLLAKADQLEKGKTTTASKKGGSKKAASKKPASKKASAKKTTAAKKPAAKKAASKKPASKKASKKASAAKKTSSKKGTATKVASKKPASKKMAKKALTAAEQKAKAAVEAQIEAAQKQAQAVAAAGRLPSAKTPAAKASAKKASKKAKSAAKKASKKASKAKAEAKQAEQKAEAAVKKTAKSKSKGKKKASKKPGSKKATSSKKGSAKKAASKKPASKKPKSKKSPKPASKPAASAAPKQAAKKGKKKTRKVSRKSSTEITVSGRKLPDSVKKAIEGKKKLSTTSKYANKSGSRTLTVQQRFANPIGNWGNVGILAGGTLVGYIVTDVVDRLVATRAGDAKYPWYSADAATRIMLRPDGMRLAAQAGVTVAFFLGSMAVQARMPRLAYFLAGAAVGSGVHALGQAAIGHLMPRLLPVEKGDERSLGNRLYPMEQNALQNPEAASVAAENKAWKDASGQQDGADANTLPASYQYPASATAPAATAGARGLSGGGKPSAAMTTLAGAPQGRPTITYPAPRGAQQVHANPRQGAFVGEPVARPATRPAIRTAPLGKPSTLACGNGSCGKPGCASCGDQAPDRGFEQQDGLNVKYTGGRPTGPAGRPTGPATSVPAGLDPNAEQPDTSQPQVLSRTGESMARAVSGPPTAYRSGPNGRPVGGRVRNRRDTGLLGNASPSHDMASHMGGFRVGRA